MIIDKPLVSIITPLYNSKDFIQNCCQSVLNQRYVFWEHIIVDDCSTDGSRDLLLELAANDSRVVPIYLDENLGSGIARNRAISKAKGRYIAFLDSDDIWAPNKLELQIELMEKMGWPFSHTSYGYIDPLGNRIKGTFHVSRNPISYVDLLKRTEISCLTAVYNQEKIGKHYLSNHRRKQDYALWLSILKSGVKSHPIDMELAFYRIRPNSATNKKYKLIFKHIKFLMETQNFSLLKSLYYTSYWMVNGIFRYFIN
jgi:teichuronic acid biosynthesis glycosyltransferase TuaG